MDSTLTLLLGILLLGSIDVSLGQRRRIRGGSGGVEFDCPEEFGYYPHPTDCTQYYVCVFGGALLESCTGGLMYSHELQTCDWPRNVGCGASSDHSSLSTVRVTDSRTRGDTRSSTRPVTVTIPSREQVQQRRQEDFVKKQYPLYSEDSRVTPESAAQEDEGPEGGERQQRVYRGQPSGLGPVSRDRDSLRHTGAVTNTIPASSISSGRGDKGVTYTLVQQQPQQQQLYSLIYINNIEDSTGNVTNNDQLYDVYVLNKFNILDVVDNRRLDQPQALRTKRQIAYRFPTGGHLVTAPRPSSYPLQWPPVSPSATSAPLAYSPKLPPNRPSLPPSPAPNQRPPPSAPPPRPSLDPPLVSSSSLPPRSSAQDFPSSSSPHRSLGEFLGLTGVEVSGRDTNRFPSQQDYRSQTTLSPDYRSLATPKPIQVYQNQVRPIVGSQGEQGVRTPYTTNLEHSLQQSGRLQQHQQRAQFPPSAANGGYLEDARGSVKAQDGRSIGRLEGISDGIRQGRFQPQDARNSDQFVEYRNMKDQQGDGRIPPNQGSRHNGHPVRIQIPIPNVNSAPTKPINFARPQGRPSPTAQGNPAVEKEPSPQFPNVLSQSAPIDTPSPVMRPPVYDSHSPLPEISPQIFVTPSYPQLPLSQRQPSQANRQIIPPNPSSHNYQSSNGNTVFVSQQQHQVTNMQRPAAQHTDEKGRVNEAALTRPQVHLPKEKDNFERERPPYQGAPVGSTDYKNVKEDSTSEEDEEDRDKDDRYDDEEAYDDEYEDEEESQEEEQRKPNPFYGEHRFGPLLNEPNEDNRSISPKPAKVSPDFSQSNFDFDAYLDRLREEVELGGHSQEKPILKGTTSTQAPVTKQIDIKYLDNPFLAPIVQKTLGSSAQQSHRNDEISSTTKVIPVPKPILQEPFKPKESESSLGRDVTQRTKILNEEQPHRPKGSSIISSTEKVFQDLYNKNPSAVKGHYILQDSPSLPNKGGIKPTLIRIPVGVSRPTSTPKKNLVEVTTLQDEDELEDEEYDEYTEETSSPHLPTESVPYRSGNHIGEGNRPWRVPITSTETLSRNQVKPVTSTTSTKAPTTTTPVSTTTTTTTLRPYIPPTRKGPHPSTTPKVASLGGSTISPRPTRPTRPPTPYRPTQRSRLRTTTSTPPKDQMDAKDEGVDNAQGNARYVADAGRQSRTRGKARPVDTSGYSDVEVSIESRPVQAQRARLVSTPATYNATTTTIYSSSVAPPVAQQYNPNYYALYDEDEVELYRDVDYSQVSGGRQTNVGTDSYRGQTNYKVQQVQQPEVVQQQSYLGRGNSNSYLSSQQQQQQQQQQTYAQQDVQPDISYGGAALESPDYNDNYNSAEDNGDIQYNQAPQQQRTSVNRNRQRGKSSAGTANRDEADRAPPSSYSSPSVARQPQTTTTTSTTSTTTTTLPTLPIDSPPRRGSSLRDGTAYVRAEPASPRRGTPIPQRATQQARRTQTQTVEVVESGSLPSRLSAAYPISSSSDSSDQPLSQNSIEPFDYLNPSRARGSFNREPTYTYSNTSDSTAQRYKPTSVLPKEKPHVRIRPTTASPESQSTTGSPSRGSSSTRNQGRGSSQYSSNSSGRQRPTLKPSTSIVSKASEFIDIYRFPASRPAPVYPQPRVDQAAAKCRKDICLLPDCNCGGKDVPGGLEPQNVPQIVLLTFDDSVNDLNKQLYSDLFEKGRKNPNGCPISATFYVSHEWTDYSQVQNLYAAGHEMASHSISHSFGEQFSQRKWAREINGQREILSAYGGVKLEDVRGMRAPFLAVGGNKMFKMLYDTNFTYDSSMPVYENRPPSWPYTFDYKVFHDCMIPPCPTRSYPGVWEVPMVMWQDLNGGRCSMGDACSNPPTSDGVYKMLIKNFERHYTTNRAPFGLYYHAAWFTQPHHKEGFEAFLDTIVAMDDVWLVTNWQAIQWVRDPTPLSHVKQFQPFGCNYPDRPRKCNNPKVCNLWHKSGVRYMRTCQPCPDVYPWTGKTGVKNSRADNEVED